jgi:hypothetical protein
MTAPIAATTAMAVGVVAFVEVLVVVTVIVEPVWPALTGIDHQSNLMQCFECRTSQSLCEHCIENPIYVFLEKELHGLNPNSYIHVSVSDLYIPRISTHIWL